MRLRVRRDKRDKEKVRAVRSPGLALDIELASGMAEGDRQALTRLVDRHAGPLYRYVARRLGPGHEALVEEVTRATFGDALRRMRPYARGWASVPMQLWLIRLANHHLARKLKRPQNAPNTDRVESAELQRLRAAMADLPSRQQAAISLALFEGLDAAEIAASLGISPARAMRLLRHALRRVGEQEATSREATGGG